MDSDDWTEIARRITCRALMGNAEPWPNHWGTAETERFLDFLGCQGIGLLVRRCLDEELKTVGLPASVRFELAATDLLERRLEDRRLEETWRLLRLLDAEAVRPLLMKGIAVAHQFYTEAHLRFRADIDMLVPSGQVDVAVAVLEQAGYRTSPTFIRECSNFQTTASRRDDDTDLVHEVDLHWRISNRLVLARVFEYEELDREAEPLPALDPLARGLGPVHALLMGALHLVGSYQPDRLLWLYDIRLATRALTAPQLFDLVDLDPGAPRWCHPARRLAKDRRGVWGRPGRSRSAAAEAWSRKPPARDQLGSALQ